MILGTLLLALEVLLIGWVAGAIARAGLARFRWAALVSLAALLLQLYAAAQAGVLGSMEATVLAIGFVFLVAAILLTGDQAAPDERSPPSVSWCGQYSVFPRATHSEGANAKLITNSALADTTLR